MLIKCESMGSNNSWKILSYSCNSIICEIYTFFFYFILILGYKFILILGYKVFCSNPFISIRVIGWSYNKYTIYTIYYNSSVLFDEKKEQIKVWFYLFLYRLYRFRLRETFFSSYSKYYGQLTKLYCTESNELK